jgi:hypothetical protein
MKAKTILVITLVSYAITAFSFLRATEKPSPLEIVYSIQEISCYDKTDGKIDIHIKGGKAPYIIVWDNGSSSLCIENLRKGEYSVNVCDALGKMISQQFIIDSPTPISLNLTTDLNNQLDFLNSKSNIKVEGGSPWELNDQPYYFYRLNDSANYNDSLIIESGIYTFTVEDSKGCKINREVYLENISAKMVERNSIPSHLPELKIRKNEIIHQVVFSDLH